MSEPADIPTDVENIGLSHDPLAVCAHWSKQVEYLENALAHARERLSAAWKLVPADNTILQRPYMSDTKATCRKCGKPTRGRLRGFALCNPVCERDTRVNLNSLVWDILGDSDDDNGSLDDDD